MYTPTRLTAIALLLATSLQAQPPQRMVRSQIPEPYPVLTATPSGEAVPESPDPLVRYRWTKVSPDDGLEIYTVYPRQATASNPEAADLGDPRRITVSDACDLMFDFGQVNAGWLEFDCDTPDVAFEASISEFNEPAVFNAGSEHPVKTAVPARYGNSFRLELNRELYEGVRFGWIHVRSLRKPAVIRNVRLICQTKPVNYEGWFDCNDPQLTRIWYTGAYTVRLNLLKDYFGAILMERSDRHSWTGDAYTAQAAALAAFGNFPFIRKNLLYTSTQDNGIASYSLYWVLSLLDYYNYTGDAETLALLTENACRKLDAAYDHYDTLPRLWFYGWDERLGAGFEAPDFREPQTAYRMLAIGTWRQFAAAMRQAGNQELAGKYERYADEKTEALRRNPRWYEGLGLFAATDAANAGFATPAEREALLARNFSDRLQRVSYSPFNQYFVLQALASLGAYDRALHTVDDCWGGQLRYGATTFFEVFRPSWNDCKLSDNDAPVNNQCGYTSLTHPWSAGVTKWLSEEVLGIKPQLPGFVRFAVKPRLAGSLTRVEGGVPTPRGIARASLDMTARRGSLTVPEGSEAEFCIPADGLRIGTIYLDGKPCAADRTNDGYYRISGIGAGRHAIRFDAEGEFRPLQTQEEIAYRIPAEKFSEDAATQGDWQDKYGSQGYVLFSYDTAGAHRVKQPDRIRSIVYANYDRMGHVHYADAAGDPRALRSDRRGDGSRSLGAIVTRDPVACWQVMTVDLDARDTQPYRISLYFADYERAGRRSAFEVFDLRTKELLAPVYMVRDYGEGKYVTFEASGSVRIRICQVRGPNAACSGIFFD